VSDVVDEGDSVSMLLFTDDGDADDDDADDAKSFVIIDNVLGVFDVEEFNISDELFEFDVCDDGDGDGGGENDTSGLSRSVASPLCDDLCLPFDGGFPLSLLFMMQQSDTS